MKAIIILFICCFSTNTLLYGQVNQLMLTNMSNGHERFIDTGKKIRVYKNGYNKIKGKLSIVDSTSIALGHDTVLLSEINIITAITKDSRSTGVFVATIGGLIMVGGVLVYDEIGGSSGGTSFDPYEALAGIIVLIGAGIASIGIGKLVVGENYKSNKWSYSIRKSGG